MSTGRVKSRRKDFAGMAWTTGTSTLSVRPFDQDSGRSDTVPASSMMGACKPLVRGICIVGHEISEGLDAGGINAEAETDGLNKGPILCGLVDDDDDAVRANVGFGPLALDHRLGQPKGIGCGALLG